ncbi:MAG: acyl carrier protein [Betaproteobacteria bacterium]
MTADEIRSVVLEALTRIAPEVEPASIEAGTMLREQLDLDSMDFLNFVVALHERLGVDIPEADYARLYTLDGAVAYLASKLPSGTRESRERAAPRA